MKVLVIDNRDSFTYNIVQIIKECGANVEIKYSEDIPASEAVNFKKVLFSPGPGLPDRKLKEIIRVASNDCSVLGICLGLQAIVEVFGGKLKPADVIYHGEAVEILVKDNYPLFEGVPDNFFAGRYNSWVADKEYLPQELVITAEDLKGEVMGIKHKKLPVNALQFHPESILTEYGNLIISNWLKE